MRSTGFSLFLLLTGICSFGQNPFLPLCEYVPDGEPYVFEDPDCPGKYRVYLYGSHDILLDAYCGRNQVVWSAPVDDLSSWRYDGVIFVSNTDSDGKLLHTDCPGDVLYAPDVALKVEADGTKHYYLYPNIQDGGRQNAVAVSDRPDGPFRICNWSKDNPGQTVGPFGFDPAAFVDDDGRAYGYWGFGRSFAAELDPSTMSTVKPGTGTVEDMVSGFQQDGVFRFFEASSIRKIEGKYVFIYSRMTEEGECGLPACNYSLAYAWSDNPLGPYTYGGTLIDGRAKQTDASGKTVITANPYGNTHGSIQQINGKWWLFYHRQTGTDEFSRQAMVAPIDVKVEGGKVIISEAEYNSEGFRTEGLNPFEKTPAALACFYVNPRGIAQDYPHFIFTGSYIKAGRPACDEPGTAAADDVHHCPLVNNTSGSVIGYKYFNFDAFKAGGHVSLLITMVPQGIDGTVTVLAGKKEIAVFQIDSRMAEEETVFQTECHSVEGLAGKQPLYFVFKSATSGKSICEVLDFQFIE